MGTTSGSGEGAGPSGWQEGSHGADLDLAVTITPRAARAYAACPRRYALTEYRDGPRLPEGPEDADRARARRRGIYLHALLARHNLVRMGGSTPDIEALLREVRPPGTLLGGGREDPELAEAARETLLGWEATLRALGVAPDLGIRGVERYLRAPLRPVRGLPGVLLAFSGRADALAVRASGELLCIDAKTGAGAGGGTTADLREDPGSYVYDLLVRRLYAAGRGEPPQRVALVEAAPLAGTWVEAELGEADREAGAARCRAMAAALAARRVRCRTGGHCTHCALAGGCPAHARPRRGRQGAGGAA